MRRALKYIEQIDHLSQRSGAAPIFQLDVPACAVRRRAREQRAADGEDMPTSQVFRLVTRGIKPDGMEVIPAGMDNSAYRENAVVFLNHRPPGGWDQSGAVTPPGRSLREWIVNGSASIPEQARGEAEFGSTDLGQELRRAYASKFMNAVSIRWDARDKNSVEEIPEQELFDAGVDPWIIRYYGGVRYLTWKLLEYSFVHLPMDSDAVAIRGDVDAMEIPEDQFPALAAAQRAALSDTSALTGNRPLLRFGPWADRTPLEVDIPQYLDIGQAIRMRAALTLDEESDTPLQWDAVAEETEGEPEAADTDAPEATEVSPEDPADETRSMESDEEAGGDDVAIGAEEARAYGQPLVFEEVHPSGVRTAKAPWNAAAARRRVRKWATAANGDINANKLRRAYAAVSAVNSPWSEDYDLIHHDVVGGELVSVRSGVIAACQRIMRDGEGGLIRAHLAEECRAHEITPPWETSSGRMYEVAYDEYRKLDPSSEEADELRATIEKHGQRAFGDDRGLEIWESRSLPTEGAQDVWGEISLTVERALAESEIGQDEIDFLVGTILACLADGVTADALTLRDGLSNLLAEMAARDLHEFDEVAELLRESGEADEDVADEGDPVTEPDADPEDDTVADEDLERLHSRLDALKASAAPPASKEHAKKTEGDLASRLQQ